MSPPTRRGWRALPVRAPLVALLGALTLVLPGCRADRDAGDPDSRTVGPASPPPSLPVPWRRVPGIAAADEALFLDEGWVVLDGLEGRVHLLDSTAAPVATVGRRGEGPGELAAPRHLARSAGGFVVVGAAGRLDHFDRRGRFQRRTRVSLAGCPVADVREARSVNGALHLALVCLRDRRRHFVLVRVDDDGSPRVLADDAAGPRDAFVLHGPILGRDGGAAVWGPGAEPCLRRIPATDPPRPPPCLMSAPVPLPEGSRRELEASLGARARSSGIRLVVPELFPWFDRIVEDHEAGLLAVRPVGETSWRLEALGSGGARWEVPDGIRVLGGAGRLLLVHESLDGVRLAPVRWSDLVGPGSVLGPRDRRPPLPAPSP